MVAVVRWYVSPAGVSIDPASTAPRPDPWVWTQATTAVTTRLPGGAHVLVRLRGESAALDLLESGAGRPATFRRLRFGVQWQNFPAAVQAFIVSRWPSLNPQPTDTAEELIDRLGLLARSDWNRARWWQSGEAGLVEE